MDQFSRSVNAQFFHNIGAMGFYGADADTEHIGDLPGGMALTDQLKNLSFTIRQFLIALCFGGTFFRRTVSVDQHFGDGGA